jgi:hypothetical protein
MGCTITWWGDKLVLITWIAVLTGASAPGRVIQSRQVGGGGGRGQTKDSHLLGMGITASPQKPDVLIYRIDNLEWASVERRPQFLENRT